MSRLVLPGGLGVTRHFSLPVLLRRVHCHYALGCLSLIRRWSCSNSRDHVHGIGVWSRVRRWVRGKGWAPLGMGDGVCHWQSGGQGVVTHGEGGALSLGMGNGVGGQCVGAHGEGGALSRGGGRGVGGKSGAKVGRWTWDRAHLHCCGLWALLTLPLCYLIGQEDEDNQEDCDCFFNPLNYLPALFFGFKVDLRLEQGVMFLDYCLPPRTYLYGVRGGGAVHYQQYY